MNKQDLINTAADLVSMKKKDMELALTAIIDTIEETVSQGEPVTLMGFGTFEKQHRAARVGRNIATKEEVNIPECYVPKFSPGKDFKEMTK